MSPSRAHSRLRRVKTLNQCLIASAQFLPARNPYEPKSAKVSANGSNASRYNACMARSRIVGMPSGLSFPYFHDQKQFEESANPCYFGIIFYKEIRELFKRLLAVVKVSSRHLLATLCRRGLRAIFLSCKREYKMVIRESLRFCILVD